MRLRKFAVNGAALLLSLSILRCAQPTYAVSEHEERAAAMESFVVLTVVPRSAPEDGKPITGSGVLVDEEGHVLTACHVVKEALDEGWRTGAPLALQPGARVVAQFVDSAGDLRPHQYALDVLACSETPDVAIVQLRERPQNLPTQSIPSVHPAGAYEICSNCLEVFGYPGHFEPHTGDGVRVDDNVGQFTAANWFGSSGGPVFYKGNGGNGSWFLTGIATSGDRVRSTTRYLVTYWGIDGLCGGLRERITFAQPSLQPMCPSYSARLLSGFSTSLDTAVLAQFVGAQTDSIDKTRRFAAEIMSWDCRENALWASTIIELVIARLTPAVNEEPSVLRLYSDLMDKLISLYALLGRGGSEVAKRGRELAAAQVASCERLQAGRVTCLVRAVRLHERLWEWNVREGYLSALRQRQDQGFWAATYVESLREWGDILHGLAFSQSAESAQTDVRLGTSILFVDAQWQPEPAERRRVPGLDLGAAALDKYANAYDALVPPKPFTSGADWDERRRKLCREVQNLLNGLRQRAQRDAPRYFQKLTRVETNQFKNCAI